MRLPPAVPASVSRPALVLAAVALAVFGISRTTGSGWLVVVVTVIASVLVLATVLPPLGLARIGLTAAAPRDATVGQPFEVEVEVGGPTRVLKLRPLELDRPGSAAWAGGWTGVEAPGRGGLPVVAARRGVLRSLTFELRSAAPLGLVWWSRRVTVPLARPVEVGPMPLGPEDHRPRGRGGDAPTARTSEPLPADVVRTIREYTTGDPIKLVHWAATARAGEVMVKELESPSAPALVLWVDLRPPPGPPARPGSPDPVEEAASRAAALCRAALGAGLGVTLLTAEATGPVGGTVASAVEAGRRLARAVAGPPPDPPAGVEVVVVSARGPQGGRR